MQRTNSGETAINTDPPTTVRPAFQETNILVVLVATPRGDNRPVCRHCKGAGKDHTWATATACPVCGGSGLAAS